MLLDPIVLLRVFYLAASALILAIQAVPALQSRFLAYGSRATSPSGPSPKWSPQKRPSEKLDQFLDSLASIQVPHKWFTHFYLVSVLCSLFWGYTISICNPSPEIVPPVQIAWLLMLLQGVRRMIESYTYTSTSQSKMWFGHWLLGLLFYLTVNVAIWIEAASTSDSSTVRDHGLGSALQSWEISLLPPLILTNHFLQHSYHAYLYQLRTQNSTYQLPSHPMFPNLLCPHYTCETLIYILLAFLAAPEGRMVNWTLLCAAIFVAVNLGVTAVGTKEWYAREFGFQKVRGRKRMVPGLW